MTDKPAPVEQIIQPQDVKAADDWRAKWGHRTGSYTALVEAFAAHRQPLAARVAALEAGLRELLAHDFADECQECGISQSDAWQHARDLLGDTK